MSAPWIAAYLLKRGRGEYRVSVLDVPTHGGWAIAEEHSICVEASTDLAALRTRVDRLCERPLSLKQASKMLADLRGGVLGIPIGGVTDRYSTIWARIGARILDGFVVMPFGLIYLAVLLGFRSIALHTFAFALCASGPLICRIWMQGKLGQTLGKMACHVIVLDTSEQPLSMRQAVLRDIVGIVLLILTFVVCIPAIIRGTEVPWLTDRSVLRSWFFYLSLSWGAIDAVTLFTNAKRRALHDFIAGSVVVRTSE
jgi:uncharacterized RDD family membrane protein YckC